MTASAINNAPAESIGKEVVFTRVFNAPLSLVFKLWTQAEHFGKWWGPPSFTNIIHQFDARPGGAIRIDMHGPNGMVLYIGGTFEEVDEPSRLVFITAALQSPDSEPFIKIRNATVFEERGGKTVITLSAAVIMAPSEQAAGSATAGMEAGLSQTLDRLQTLVQELSSSTADRELTGNRIFNASRELVFKMWTDPDHIVKWFGPNGFRNTIFEMDVRPGGKWRHILHGPDGVDYKNESVYLEVVPPERLVYQHLSGPAFVATVTFEELGKQTRVNMHMLFDSAEVRDITVKVHNAAEGLQQTLQRLDDEIARLTL